MESMGQPATEPSVLPAGHRHRRPRRLDPRRHPGEHPPGLQHALRPAPGGAGRGCRRRPRLHRRGPHRGGRSAVAHHRRVVGRRDKPADVPQRRRDGHRSPRARPARRVARHLPGGVPRRRGRAEPRRSATSMRARRSTGATASAIPMPSTSCGRSTRSTTRPSWTRSPDASRRRGERRAPSRSPPGSTAPPSTPTRRTRTTATPSTSATATASRSPASS